MSNSRTHSFVALAIVAAALSSLSPALSFAPPQRLEGVATRHPTTTSSAGLVIGSTAPSRYNIMKLLAESEDGESSSTATADDPKKLSLEEKMKSWEASEEEIKAASLGGITAGSKGGTDGFDVGLWVMASLKICLACFLYFLPWLYFEDQPVTYFANITSPTQHTCCYFFHYLLCSSHSSWLLVCFSLYSRSSKILLTFQVLVHPRWSKEL